MVKDIELNIKGNTKINTMVYVILGLMLVCVSMSGIAPQIVLTISILLLCCCLFAYDALYLAFPIFLFYYSYLGMVFGLSAFRIYTILFLLSYLLKHFNIQKSKVNLWLAGPLFVYLFYVIIVVSEYSVQKAFFAFIDIIVCLILTTCYLSDKERYKQFFTVYVIVALIAGATGLILGNSYVEKIMVGYSYNSIEHSRFMATFEDPNYMGFFYTIAIFTTISLKLFKPILRNIIVGILYTMIIMSVSITAVVVNVILWAIYFLITGKWKIKHAAVVALLLIALLSIYSYGVNHHEAPLIGQLCYRVNLKIQDIKLGDMSSATTGRTDLTQQHLEFFSEQPLVKKIFGGTASNTSYLDNRLSGMAHNEYVDMLLNVGILGTAVLLIYIIQDTIKKMIAYQQTRDEHYFSLFMNKMIWILYATSLTIFLDYRFIFIFFL